MTEIEWRRVPAAYGVLGAAATALAILIAPPAAADSPRVVVSIKPIHSIVADVMSGVGKPTLLLPDGASPHAFVMRPSVARQIRRADLVIWVGEELESFLGKPLKTLSKDAMVVELMRDAAITKLNVRATASWPHQKHGHDDHHASKPGRKDHDHRNHEQRHHDHGDHSDLDPHIWLDPVNARAIARIAAKKLAGIDRANAARYLANGARVSDELRRLEQEIRTSVAPLKNVRFVVFHDSYQYFERRFGLSAVGSITLSPERKPGAKRLSAIRRAIIKKGARCVFAEPQFRSSLIETVVRGTRARSGILDPLGAGIPASSGAYATMLRGLTASLRLCLSNAT